MKKLLILAVTMLTAIVGYCDSDLSGGPTSLNTRPSESQSIAPQITDTYTLGDATHRYKYINSSGTYGGTVQSFSIVDLAAATSAYNLNVYVTTTVAKSSTVYAGAPIKQPVQPRNLVASMGYGPDLLDAQTPITSMTVVGGQCIVTGIDQNGDTKTETLTVYQTSGVAGNIAFSYITSLAFSMTNLSGFATNNTGWTSILLQVGPSTKIGIPGDVNYSDDIIQVNGGTTSGIIDDAAYTLNLQYNTIIFGTVPDGTNDYQVIYKNKNIK